MADFSASEDLGILEAILSHGDPSGRTGCSEGHSGLRVEG